MAKDLRAKALADAAAIQAGEAIASHKGNEPRDLPLEDHDATPEMLNQQDRYQKLIAEVVLPLLNSPDPREALNVINALAANLVFSIRGLRRSGLLSPEAVERIGERFKLSLLQPSQESSPQRGGQGTFDA
jgi:hypothetical protein